MFYLKVPYNEKDKASRLGAIWDGEKKKWFVPPDVDLEFFLKWVEPLRMDEALKIIEDQKPEKGIKLSNLLTKVKNSIEEKMEGFYWVNAEIANLQYKGSTLYLQLVETGKKGEQICNNRAVIWGRDLEHIQTKFKNETGQDLQKGINVLIKVKVQYSIKYQLSIIVLDIEPSFTLGGMESKIKQIRDKIKILGILENNKKLKLPEYFKNIAVVSPEDAAGLGDFKADADRLMNNNVCNFNYYTATFQGEKTNLSVSKAVSKASMDVLKNNYDAIVVIRGGGAKTDLHFLNEFDIAKNIASASVPVIVGIGHERDHVLIDEIAHSKFDTPSKVIAFILNNNVNYGKSLNDKYEEIKILKDSILINFKNKTQLSYQEINSYIDNLISYTKSDVLKSYNEIKERIYKRISITKIEIENNNSEILFIKKDLVKKNEAELNICFNDIQNLKEIQLSNNKTKVDITNREIKANVDFLKNKYKNEISFLMVEIDKKNPLNTLNNGYAIIKDASGNIIKTINELNKNKTIKIIMKDGEKEFRLT